MPKMLAFSVMQTVETLNANLLNNGFNVLFPGADGEPLFSLVHPNPGGGTFSNTLATPADLSDSSFEQALIDVANLENGRNLKIKVQAMKLIVDPTEFYTASKILESTLEPESANNAINPAKGILPGSFMQDHYLSDPDAWFLRTNVEGLICQKRRFPAEFTKDLSVESFVAKFLTFFRMAVGFYDARSIYGSPGA